MRTVAPLLAKQVLKPAELIPRDGVRGRVELPTSTVSVWRSNQLSDSTGTNARTTASPALLPPRIS